MVWANLTMLLVGSLLIAAPIALHLAMRPKPKRIEFPALRFVAHRQLANRRQLRMRHLLLLLLRCLVILLPAAALARPMVSSALATDWLTAGGLMGMALVAAFLAVAAWSRRARPMLTIALTVVAALLLTSGVGYAGLLWLGRGQRSLTAAAAPVAAAFVIDTSPRMAYRQRNQTRLEQAQATVASLVEQLPSGSQMAVIDSQSAAAVYSLDQAAALKAIEQMRPGGAPRELSQIVLDALDLLGGSELERRELYIATDLTAAAWEEALDSSLAERLAAASDTAVYLLDVGVAEPQNTALGEVVLSSETPVRGAPLLIETLVSRLGGGSATGVELLLEDRDPSLPVIRDGELVTAPLRARGRREVNITGAAGETVRFELGGLEPGVYHGLLRLAADDALPIDNVRYFTLEIELPPAVLAVAPDGVAAQLATDAIAPLELRKSGQALFRIATVEQSQLAGHVLEEYQAVLLLDPAPLPASVWSRLGDFARAGGGVGIFLGRNATPMAAFSDPAAQALLPGPLKPPWNAGTRLCFLAPQEFNHPALAGFRTVGSSVPWSAMSIEKHWQFGELSDEASTILYTNYRNPALLERKVGAGRVVTMTTPVTDRAYQAGRSAWNTLPTALDNWPFVVLLHDLTNYLAGSGNAKLNYLAGESAELGNDRRRYPQQYELFLPGQAPQTITALDDRLSVNFTAAVGTYRLKGYLDEPVARGFSVNYPPQASRLERADKQLLDQALGADRYRLMTGQEEIERELSDIRVGREFYPYLLLMAALVLALEQLMANMFYRPQASQAG